MEKNRKEAVFAELGKYSIDISKLVFGGVILAGIMKLDVNKIALFGLGILVVIATLVAGLIFTALSNSKK